MNCRYRKFFFGSFQKTEVADVNPIFKKKEKTAHHRQTAANKGQETAQFVLRFSSEQTSARVELVGHGRRGLLTFVTYVLRSSRAYLSAFGKKKTTPVLKAIRATASELQQVNANNKQTFAVMFDLHAVK